MSFSRIGQSLANIDYSWTKPQTYAVFVPGLSLLVQKIQLANTLPLINDVTYENRDLAKEKIIRFANICKWHLLGSMTQLLLLGIARKAFGNNNLFFLLQAAALSQMTYTLLSGQRTRVIYTEFHENRNRKSSVYSTIFYHFFKQLS